MEGFGIEMAILAETLSYGNHFMLLYFQIIHFVFQPTIHELRWLPKVGVLLWLTRFKYWLKVQVPFFRYKFYPTFFNGTWVSDTEILFRDRVNKLCRKQIVSLQMVFQFGGLSIRDVSTSSTRTVVSHNQFLQIHPASYKFSADRWNSSPLQMPLNIDDAIVSSLWQQKVYVSCVLHVLWYSWFYRQEIPSCKNLQPTSLATFFLWWLRLAQNGSKWTPSVFCGAKIFVTVQNRSFITNPDGTLDHHNECTRWSP